MSHKYLITGAAGFIGFFLTKKLLEAGEEVIGIDNLNDYYGVNLKIERLKLLDIYPKFIFYKVDLSDKDELSKVFEIHNFDYVVNLAAQAGVRYSIENPDVYITSNIIGFYNILEMVRHHPVKHLVYASSSSVYGNNDKVPFEESDFVDNPISLYAATKKTNELMAHTYSHLYGIYSTGLRFFTVYGPWGRPDMAYFKFIDLFFENKPLLIYNAGDFENDLWRDFTYIDDIVDGILQVIPIRPSQPRYQVFNIGNQNPVKLMDFIRILEKCLSVGLNQKIEFKKIYESKKPGDVHKTFASMEKISNYIGFCPKTSLEEGLQLFVNWYLQTWRNK